jgi:beta-glucanase (GH16 family)
MKLRKFITYMLLFTIGVLAFGWFSSPAMAATILVDFEGGVPGGWFEFSGGGATVATSTPTVGDTDPLARPGQVGDNTFLLATFDATTGFAGFGQDFTATTGPQNWINYAGVSFWMYGTGSGNTYQFEIFDNSSDGTVNTAERFDTLFTDDFTGWQQVDIPFADFTRAVDFQPPGAPDDGLTLTEMWGWAVPLDGNAGTLYMDDIGLEQAIVDDFESGLPTGTDGDGNGIGFITFSDGASGVAISTTDAPPAPVPGSAAGNQVLQVDTNVVGGGFAGLVHAFENDAVNTWTPQDWSGFSGLSFWLYGNNTGSVLFVDVLDNRNPGSTTDDAERFSLDIIDDFSGWQFFELPWEAFSRKEIGNGAPNDGFTLTEVHGWAFGVFSSGQAFINYMDDVGLFGIAEIPDLAVTFSMNNYDIPEGDTGSILVKLNRPMNEDDPAQVSVDYFSEPAGATPERDYTPVSGTLVFVNGGPAEQTFPLETFDNPKQTFDKRVILRLSNPVDVAPGFIFQASATILDGDPFDPNLIDDFERYPYLWSADDSVVLHNPEFTPDDPFAVPGQGAYEGVLEVRGPELETAEILGSFCNQGRGVIPVHVLTTPDFDATTVDHRTVMLGMAHEFHQSRWDDGPMRHEEDVDGDGDIDLVFHFRFKDTGLDCDATDVAVTGWTYGANDGARFGHDFALGQDWRFKEGLKFWYYGQNTGDDVTVQLLDNRAMDPGPGGWSLAWSDEFDDPAGTPPNPAYWGYEIGDGTVNGIPGWGNAELQYYTDSTDNVATDGQGNLVITAREADGSYLCYYGPCEYTSARLVSKHRAEFAYGRIESRILVPDGDDGLWPAFWSLGTDIDLVDWPQTGEIDIMEYVSRLPEEIFGTIHGPGYAGGQSFGNTYPFPGGVSTDYHTFTIEWQPDLIEWYVDGNLYHTATPADVAPNEWVFNDPIYLLMNMAIGGNFGGPVSDNTVFPQTMTVDYVRVYQGADTAERFESSFADNFTGWREVVIPFDTFTRSADQPAGAPNDGLGLEEVWGYGFQLPDSGWTTGHLLFDQVRILAPTSLVVTNTDNDGIGSLRWAADVVAGGGTVLFDPALAGQTINLNGPLVIPAKELTIDAVDAPGITLNGGGTDRVLIVDSGANVTAKHLVITNGYGFYLAGGILNNGNLTLDHVSVTGNAMATDGGDFWQGGGGIYNGGGATLYLVDSSVSNNTAQWSGGGIYSFFDTTTTIVRSTISGNISNDVGGGLRLLGNADITNSTISGNQSTGWHGGAIFQTDGDVSITSSTIANNIAPDYAPSTLFIGQFGGGFVPTLTLANTIITGNQWYACEKFASGTTGNVVSAGYNVVQDDSCNPVTTDQIIWDALIGPLADNGGPTMTHALLPGSPAIDAAGVAACPATDQRGVVRPQGSGCDIGSYEYEATMVFERSNVLESSMEFGR